MAATALQSRVISLSIFSLDPRAMRFYRFAEVVSQRTFICRLLRIARRLDRSGGAMEKTKPTAGPSADRDGPLASPHPPRPRVVSAAFPALHHRWHLCLCALHAKCFRQGTHAVVQSAGMDRIHQCRGMDCRQPIPDEAGHLDHILAAAHRERGHG